jgi:hypothetical protein
LYKFRRHWKPKKVSESVQYSITASYNGTPSIGTEEQFGTAEWQFGGASATAGSTITPSAAETTWSSSNTRSLTGVGTTIDEHIIYCFMRVRFDITDKNTDAHIRYAEYSGRGTAKLKITTGKFKIIVTPTDNFTGRSRHRLGVGETATLDVESIPPGSTVTIVSGTATEPNPSGTGTIEVAGMSITAGDYAGAGTIKVKAEVNGQISTESLQLLIVEPTGVQFIERSEYRNTYDRVNPIPASMRGAAFCANTYVQPTDVSFQGLSFGEEGEGGKLGIEVKAERNGNLKDLLPELHPAWYESAEGGNISTGCRIGGINSLDEVGFKSWYISGNGNFVWDIPWSYQTSTMNSPKVFLNMLQQMRNIGDELSTVSKNGITVERTIF